MKNLSLMGILLVLLTSCLATKEATTLDSNHLTTMTKPTANATLALLQETKSSSQLPQLINSRYAFSKFL